MVQVRERGEVEREKQESWGRRGAGILLSSVVSQCSKIVNTFKYPLILTLESKWSEQPIIQLC